MEMIENLTCNASYWGRDRYSGYDYYKGCNDFYDYDYFEEEEDADAD